MNNVFVKLVTQWIKNGCKKFEKVMFLQVSVILFRGGSGVTITRDALDLTIQSLLGHGTLPTGTAPPHLLVTSGGHHWRPVQTCSLQDQNSHWCCHLVAIESCKIGESKHYVSITSFSGGRVSIVIMMPTGAI